MSKTYANLVQNQGCCNNYTNIAFSFFFKYLNTSSTETIFFSEKTVKGLKTLDIIDHVFYCAPSLRTCLLNVIFERSIFMTYDTYSGQCYFMAY